MKEIVFEVGLEDSRLVGYARGLSEVKVFVETWNARKVQITFLDAEGIRDLGLGDLKGVFELPPSEFLGTVLSEIYVESPADHPYRSFAFMNLDDRPRLEVIAKDIHIGFADD